jgi:hypothetical protein
MAEVLFKMAEIVKTLLTQILLRNDVETNWKSANPILGKGEIAISTDKNQFKIGDGTSNWSALGYFEGALNTRVADLEAHKTSYEAKVNALETEVGMGATDGKTRIDTLEETVSRIVSVGGEANVIEGVAVKTAADGSYEELTITEKVAQLDLSGYAVKSEVANTLASYYTSAQVDGLIANFVDTTELANELANYVTLKAYNEKVAALEKADQDLDAAVKAIYKKEGEAESGVLVEKLTAAANDVNGKLADYYTKTEIDGKVQTINSAIDGKVAQSDYNTKVGELVAEDQRIAGLVATEKGRAEQAEAGLQTNINNVDAKFANYETATEAQGKYETKANAESTYLKKADAQSTYETIAEADKVRNRVTAVEEALNGTTEGETHVPGLVEKVQTHENEIKALQQAQAGGLVREIITKEQLAALVAAPSTAADNVIYMVPSQGAGTGEANDVYDEYIKVRTSAEGVEPATYAIEFLGDTEVDLSQYYTKTEIAELGHATVTYVDAELAKKVSIKSYDVDQNNLKGRVDKVEAKLSDIAENEKVKAVIDAAVKVEKDRAELAEKGLGDRITAVENLKISETYATKAELEIEAGTRKNNDNVLEGRIKTLEDKGLEDASTYATKEELEVEQGRISTLEGKVDVAKVSEAIAAAVKVEKDRAEAAESSISNNIDAETQRINALIGTDVPAQGEDQKSIRDIAAEVHAEKEVVKSAGKGLVIEDHVIKFAEGIFVLDGGNASLMASIETDENEAV